MYNFKFKIKNVHIDCGSELLNSRFDKLTAIDLYDNADFDLRDERLMISANFNVSKDNYEFDITQGY